MKNDYMQKLIASFPGLIFQQDVSLAPFTFMKVGGPAKLFVEVNTIDDLFALTSFCFQNQIPFTIIGGVSNSVIPDEGLGRLVILNRTNKARIGDGEFFPIEEVSNSKFKIPDDSEKIHITTDSGVITAKLASATMQLGLTGLEHFVGVPGTIGGAVYNNSHFTAHELIGNFILQVEVCTEEGKRESWGRDRLKFGYDQSVFHENKAVILRAKFELHKGDSVHIQEKMREAAKKRTATQPIGIPSTGCMFRNPKVSAKDLARIKEKIEVPESAIKEVNGQTQLAAGFLIDKAGLKGTTVGEAQVSEKHATYIINLGNATAKDIENLCQVVEKKVFAAYNVLLEREVFFL